MEIADLAIKSSSGRILAWNDIHDYNSFDNPDKITPKQYNGAIIKGNDVTVKMPAASVIVLTLI